MDAALDSTVIPRGIEISKGLAQVSDEKLKGMDGEVVQAPAIEGMYELPDDSQDMILLHSFLEHEVNPLELLKASSKKLSKKGLLIIKVPNYESWNRKVRQAKWCGFRYPDHVNYFSPKTLKLFIEAANLKVYRMNFFDRIPTSDNVWVIAERKSS